MNLRSKAPTSISSSTIAIKAHFIPPLFQHILIFVRSNLTRAEYKQHMRKVQTSPLGRHQCAAVVLR